MSDNKESREALLKHRDQLKTELDALNPRFNQLALDHTNVQEELQQAQAQLGKAAQANAQLAGERHKLADAVKALQGAVDELQKQLALERNERAKAMANLQHADRLVQQVTTLCLGEVNRKLQVLNPPAAAAT